MLTSTSAGFVLPDYALVHAVVACLIVLVDASATVYVGSILALAIFRGNWRRQK